MASSSSSTPGALTVKAPLSWKDGSLAAYLASCSCKHVPASNGAEAKADAAARIAELIARINALKASTLNGTTDPDQQTLRDSIELDYGCMLREMGEWCACCT